jgi:hypothetical protein
MRGAWLTLLAACSALPELEPNTCGNGVVEPGEDCDLYVNDEQEDEPGPFACGSACRYVCPAGGPFLCPSGFSCGEEICKLPSGTFAQGEESPLALDSTELGISDVDGDGIDDIVGGSADAIEVRFGVGDGTFRESFLMTVDFPLGERILTDLDADGRADVVIPSAVGFDVLHGDPARQLIPGTYSPFPLSQVERPGTLDVVLLSARFDADRRLERPFGLGLERGALYAKIPSNVEIGRQVIDPSLEAFAGVEVADLTGDGADEVVIGMAGAAEIWLARLSCAVPCLPAAERMTFERLPLESGVLRSDATMVFDLEGDGDRDILASIDGELGPGAVVLRNQGAATFDRIELPAPPVWPLAIGEGPGGPLAVLPAGIAALSTASASLTIIHHNPLPAWERAVLGDFDGDGAVDVAAVSRLSSVTLLFTEASSVFHRVDVALPAPPSLIASGDFDGDGTDDVAAVVRVERISEVYVLYGNRSGPPEPPSFMARIDGLASDMRTTGFATADPPNRDLIDDLLLEVGSRGNGRALLLIGSVQRRLRSPILLERDYEFSGPYEIAAGRFDARAGVDLAALTVEGDVSIATSTVDPGGNLRRPVSELCGQSIEDLRSRCARLEAGDFSTGGGDELVIASRSGRCEGNVELSVVSLGVGAELACETIDLGRDGLVRHRVARYDGDSTDDVVLLFDAPPHVVVVSARGVTTLPELPIPPGESTIDLVVFGGSIAVLGTDGVYANTKDPTKFERVVEQRIPPGGRIQAIRANGDGLPDLIFGTSRRTYVYLAGERFQNQ